MTVLYPAERPVALAVKALLEAELGATLVGYGKKPAGGGWQTTGTPGPDTAFKGYAVVFAGQTTPGEGTAADPGQDALQGWQVTSYGATSDQADAIRDRCRQKLLSTRLVVTGRHCDPTQLAVGQNTVPDKDVNPTIYFAADQFTAYTTPG